MNESINKTLAAIRALPTGTFLYADKRTVTEGEFLALKSADLIALADEYESMRLMLEAATDIELNCGSLERVSGVWRAITDLNDEDRDLYPFDTPQAAFKALQGGEDA